MLRQLEQQQQHQAGPSSPHSMASTATTPRTPKPPQPSSSNAADTSSKFAPAEGGNCPPPAAATPDRLQPHSAPATPATLDSAGDAPEGRAAWGSPGFGHAQMRVTPASPEMSPDPRRKHERLTGLPSAEDIDALFDMDTPSHHAPGNNKHHQVNGMCPPMYPALPPVLTHSSGASSLADRPSKPGGVPSLYPHDSSTPQHSSSSQFKHGLSRQPFPPSSSRPDVPESSAPCSHSFRLQSECDSSAYDEVASSTLIHSISNEEQSMHDLLGDDNDDIFYNVMDTQQHDPEAGVERHRMPQLNTMELHGLLGQHGYKLPELAGDQEDDEESDGDDGVGDGDEDLDDPDDDDDDEDASKAIFKVGARTKRLFVFIRLERCLWQNCCTVCKCL